MIEIKNNEKINLAIIFGGKSAEHEVSILSAKSVVEAIDKSKYNISLVGINKEGNWLSVDEQDLLKGNLILDSGRLKDEEQDYTEILSSGNKKLSLQGDGGKIDVVFPILHGPFGEDGTIQGFLRMMDVAFVGPSVLGSAVNMDKDVSKRLLREAGLPTSKFLVFQKDEEQNISFAETKKELGLPLFIKPANLGSSVGISKVEDKKDFEKAIEDAFRFDSKIIIEEGIEGKEIECSVLGNENPLASTLGEIIPTHDFYSYDAKYFDEDGAKMAIPANIPKDITKKIQEMAVKTFKTLCCEGMGRVDFFLTKDNKIFVNEINTIPGFTPVSMYPKLWAESGIDYSELIDKLIQLAVDRKNREDKLKTSV
jgi:D-alanine-D-alanine ligase